MKVGANVYDLIGELYMYQYKGIIFNSVNVELLNGKLGEAVRSRNIRTAVVSRKKRSDVKRALKKLGVSVDFIAGADDFNTRYRTYVKPMADPYLIAVAMLHLEAEDVAVLGDYKLDREGADNAGLDYFRKPEEIIPLLSDYPSDLEMKADYEGYRVPTRGIIGAVCGDVVGSAYEFHSTDNYDFEPFVSRTHVTDDSVATLSVAKWLMGDRSREYLVKTLLGVCNRHPNVGYGSNFKRWLRGKAHSPYGGCTNGAMMRASACGWVAGSLEEALELGRDSACVSHDSEEGIHGAQAVSASIYLLRTGHTKTEVKQFVETNLGFNLDMTLEEHRSVRSKDISCHISGPQAFRAWLDADTYEQAVRNAVTLRTDADTVADIAGALAAATPGMEVPAEWAQKVFGMLDDELKRILYEFYARYSIDSTRPIN